MNTNNNVMAANTTSERLHQPAQRPDCPRRMPPNAPLPEPTPEEFAAHDAYQRLLDLGANPSSTHPALIPDWIKVRVYQNRQAYYAREAAKNVR